jgi:ferritin-like metal-binding protein YciE
MMIHHDFQKLFLKELRELISAENQLYEALKSTQEAASSPELKKAIEEIQLDTQAQLERLQVIFSILEQEYKEEYSEGMRGMIAENEALIKSNFQSIVKDAALIGGLQRIAHDGIASYGIAKAFARHLEQGRVYDLLAQSLEEKGNMDKNLTAIAEGGFFSSGLNEKAKSQ